LRLTISHGDIQTLIKNKLADIRAPQAEIFAEQISQLKGAGADVAALTSLGAHYCFDELKAISPLPLVSALTPLDGYFQSQGLKRVRALFLDAGKRMISELEADAIVLAGTDLNLAFDGQATGYRVVDALDVHVDVLAQIAAGEIALDDTENSSIC